MNLKPGNDTSRPVYLDHAATTPLDPAALRAMEECLQDAEPPGNPSSNHLAGRRARAIVDASREALAGLLNASPRELIYTSGATEADNLAVIGGARFRAHRGRHVVTLQSEHKAVLAACNALEAEGFEVTRLAPGADGRVDLDELQTALRADTQLVSVMHVNNETGVVQDIAAIGELCHRHDVLFHCDAAQSVGKLPLDLASLPVDLLSISAHKMNGPQGIGALFIRSRAGCGVKPLLHGGAQERRLRPGTLPLALVAGFGAAASAARDRQPQALERVAWLGGRLWSGIESVPGLQRNGSPDWHYPGILNVSLADIEGESLMLALEPVCVASGSACNSQSGEPSTVLRSMGLSDLQAQGAIRFSFGHNTTEAEIDFAIRRLIDAVGRLRKLSLPVAESA